MKPSKKKYLELIFMFIFACVFYLFYSEVEGVSLFVLGFIWNWSSTINLDSGFSHRSYRFSMLKTAVNFQNLLIKPFLNGPILVQRLVRIFPAGIFWSGVIFINDSNMPWWSTFIGSLSFEVLQLELEFLRNEKKIS